MFHFYKFDENSDKQKEEEIKNMISDKNMVGRDGHFNLFVKEEFEMEEKDREITHKDRNNPFLKRTSNLGELFEPHSNPWYSNKNKQMSKFQKTDAKEVHKLSRYEAKYALNVGKFLVSLHYFNDFNSQNKLRKRVWTHNQFRQEFKAI